MRPTRDEVRHRKFRFPRILNGNPLDGYSLRISKTESCWNWIGSIAKNGYGTYPTAKKYWGTHWAHRIAYILNKGDIPVGMEVMHECNNKLCVNPNHLTIGTHQQNENHKVAHHRHLTGESHPLHRLTWDIIDRIRDSNKSLVEISSEYGVSKSHICNIRKGKSWKPKSHGTPS